MVTCRDTQKLLQKSPKVSRQKGLEERRGAGRGKSRKTDPSGGKSNGKEEEMVMEVRCGYKERPEKRAEWGSQDLQFKLKINKNRQVDSLQQHRQKI